MDGMSSLLSNIGDGESLLQISKCNRTISIYIRSISFFLSLLLILNVVKYGAQYVLRDGGKRQATDKSLL